MRHLVYRQSLASVPVSGRRLARGQRNLRETYRRSCRIISHSESRRESLSSATRPHKACHQQAQILAPRLALEEIVASTTLLSLGPHPRTDQCTISAGIEVELVGRGCGAVDWWIGFVFSCGWNFHCSFRQTGRWWRFPSLLFSSSL